MVPTILEGLSDEVRRGFSTYIIGLCMELHYSFAAPFFGVLLLFFLISAHLSVLPDCASSTRGKIVLVHDRLDRPEIHRAPFIGDSLNMG